MTIDTKASREKMAKRTPGKMDPHDGIKHDYITADGVFICEMSDECDEWNTAEAICHAVNTHDALCDEIDRQAEEISRLRGLIENYAHHLETGAFGGPNREFLRGVRAQATRDSLALRSFLSAKCDHAESYHIDDGDYFCPKCHRVGRKP